MGYLYKNMNSKNYFDLVMNKDLSILSIIRIDNFNCQIIDNNKIVYNGFILAKSEQCNIYTVCDFQKSDTDEKYQARLSFRKTDKDFISRNVNKGSDEVIIPFVRGQDGYREFWKMISFLYAWRDTIDLGEFEDYFSVTDQNLSRILPVIANIENKEQVLESLGKLTDNDLENLNNLISLVKIRNILKIWDDNKENYDEEFWQKTFNENSWVLSQVFSAPYIKIGDKFYCGGKEDNNSGGVIGDFLYQNELTKNVAFIEIKTPREDIVVGGVYRGKTSDGENTIYSITEELSGAINQVLNQRKTYLKEYQEKNGRYLNNSKCVVIIGITPSDDFEIKSFDLFRSSQKDVEIITYDELFGRIQCILQLFE